MSFIADLGALVTLVLAFGFAAWMVKVFLTNG